MDHTAVIRGPRGERNILLAAEAGAQDEEVSHLILKPELVH